MAIPKKVAERIASGMKRLVPILEQQKVRDVSEADTVTLVKDILSEVFGYDKYSELTGELAIRGTYCDLAIRLDEKIAQIIEVKAVGITLNDRHVKQAIDYAANQGIEWVVLTNAVVWRLYHVIFSKPIDKQLITEVDLMACDPKKDEDLETLHLFSKDGFLKGAPSDRRDRQDATNRFLLAAVILNNDSVVSVIRRELRRIVDIMVSEEDILKVLENEVIKRDVLEGPAAETALGRVRRTCGKSRRQETPKPAEAPASDSATAKPAPVAEETPAPDTPGTCGEQPPTLPQSGA
jgi:hypothetical protein